MHQAIGHRTHVGAGRINPRHGAVKLGQHIARALRRINAHQGNSRTEITRNLTGDRPATAKVLKVYGHVLTGAGANLKTKASDPWRRHRDRRLAAKQTLDQTYAAEIGATAKAIAAGPNGDFPGRGHDRPGLTGHPGRRGGGNARQKTHTTVERHPAFARRQGIANTHHLVAAKAIGACFGKGDGTGRVGRRRAVQVKTGASHGRGKRQSRTDQRDRDIL